MSCLPVRIGRPCATALGTAVFAFLIGTGPSYGFSGPAPKSTPEAAPLPRRPAASTALPHGATLLQALKGGRPVAFAAAGGLPRGVDVSSNQHSGGGAIDWGQVHDAGYQFAWVKTTEGNYYANPHFAGDYNGAKSAKLYSGAYHFAIPSASDGANQADFFLDSASYSRDGATLPPALDIEWNPYGQSCYGMDGASLVSWVGAFRAEVQHRTGRLPVIYTAASWWNDCTGGDASFTADGLWVAAYDVSSPQLPSGWPSWTMWQYTSSASVPGIAGEVDASYFIGSEADLASFAGKPPPPPPPPPPPQTSPP
jgi:GH25 family lysozyme M1 (1,4-beta-N-acetylmuramidase)